MARLELPALHDQEAAIITAIADSRCNLNEIARRAAVPSYLVAQLLARSTVAQLAFQHEAQSVYDEFAEAIRVADGHLGNAAKRLGISYDSLSIAVNASPYLQAVRSSIRQQMIDDAELALWDGIKNGNRWAILAALRSRAAEERKWHENSTEVQHLVTVAMQKWRLTDD